MLTLRPYQNDAVNALRAEYAKGCKSVLFTLPTGGGKTVVFSYVAQNAIAKGNKVLVLVHRIELVRQASEAFDKLGVKHGIINPRYKSDYSQDCQIASVQTMVGRLDEFCPDLIVIDEAHHSVAGTWNKIVQAYPSAKVLGVTATPCRSDGRGLSDVFCSMVIGPSIAKLVEMGYLCKAVVYAPPVQFDVKQVKIQMGDFAKNELLEIVNKPTVTGDAIAHYKKFADGQPAVVFCINIKHAQQVADQFRTAGYIAYSVDGNMSDVERSSILNGLGNGTVQVVTSCDLISEGTDIPAVSVAILLRPTQSEGLFLQQVGRALRLSEGKKEAIILDHAGNCLRHGHPLADREWSLDAKAKKLRKGQDQEPLIPIRTCDVCYCVFKPAPSCPMCGAKQHIKERDIKTAAGDLEELAIISKAKKREVGRARSLEELLRIEKERGYKKGWAWRVFNSRKK